MQTAQSFLLRRGRQFVAPQRCHFDSSALNGESLGMYPFTVYVVLYCFLNRQVEGRQVADPYGLSCFACFRSIGCYQNRWVAGGWYPPLRTQNVLDSTFLVKSLSKPLPECPLQSLRRQLFNYGIIATGNDCY